MSDKKVALILLAFMFLGLIVFLGPFLALLPWFPAMIVAFVSEPDKDPIPNRGSFYTFTASYLVDQVEPLNFDFVVGCTDYDFRFPGDRQGMLPGAYAKQTSQGHVVMIVVQSLCKSYRPSDLDKLDATFLPLVIWFESASKLDMGLGYSTIQAYESPESRLSFLGASIRAATQEEFLEWYASRNENLLTNAMFDVPEYKSDDSWFTDPQPVLPHDCYSMGFADAGPKAQEFLTRYWPETRPHYWSQTDVGREKFSELERQLNGRDVEFYAYNFLNNSSKNNINKVRWYEWEDLGKNNLNKSKYNGGRFRQSAERYPLYYSDSISFLMEGRSEPGLSVNVDYRPETRGFSACYNRYGWYSKRADEPMTELEKRIFGGDGKFNTLKWHMNNELVMNQNLSVYPSSIKFVIENEAIAREEKESFQSKIVR